jgi:hypothetical protein
MRLDPLGQKLGQCPDQLAFLLAGHRLRVARQEPQRALSARLCQARASGRTDYSGCRLSATSCQLLGSRRREMGQRRTGVSRVTAIPVRGGFLGRSIPRHRGREDVER